jgi:hypothetical protein
MIPPRRHCIAPLLLTLLLAGGPLAAAPHEPSPREAWQSRLSVTRLLSEVWVFVSRIWEKEGGSTDPFGKAGGSTDPFGKAGGGIDPFGNPASNTAPSQPVPGL